MLSNDEASSPFLPNKDSSLPRRINARRPTSARASFMQQRAQPVLSQTDKTSAGFVHKSHAGHTKDVQTQKDFDMGSNSTARYRSTAAGVSFTEPATAFPYSTSFMPGVHFYTFLAPKEATPARESQNQTNCSPGNTHVPLSARKHSALKLNIPDTILYGETGCAVWIYTDKEGYVQRMTTFSEKHVLDKFAEDPPVTADGQRLVVHKKPIIAMAPAADQSDHGGRSSASFNSQGNQLCLLNLEDVKALLNGVKAMHKSFALQQFVKCNGSKAFIQRAVYEAGKPPHAWMISNIEPLKELNRPSSPFMAAARSQTTPRPRLIRLHSSPTIATSASGSSSVPLVSRLCTSVQTDKSCTFVKLTERGCAAVSELNLRIVRYIEQRLRVALQTFVADFIKDAAGKWWLLQVKAFQVQPTVHTGRVFSLPIKSRMAYLNYRDTAIFDEDDDENSDDNDQQQSRHCRRSIIPLSQRSVHKLVQCKCCLAAYPISELSFKMTLKMISDMLLRIRSQHLAKKRLPILSAAFARELPESAAAYESWSVCNLCYAIYERGQKLQRIETKFSAALGLPNRKTVAEGLSRIQESNYTSGSSASALVVPLQLTLCRLILVINAIYDIPPELYNAEQENARIEAAAQEVAVAEGRPQSQRANPSRLYLRINVLGYTECIPINSNDIMEASEKAPAGARRRRSSGSASSMTDDDGEEAQDDSDSSEPELSSGQGSWQRPLHSLTARNQQSPVDDKVNYWLPTNLIRTVPFFAPRTPLVSKLKETSGLTPFLTENNSVRVQLIRATEPPLQDPSTLPARQRPRTRRSALRPSASNSETMSQMHGSTHSIVLGSTKIRMTQFRSSYVTKIDYYACMAITGEMLNIKGNIGLERVRYVDSKLLTSQHRLRFYNGLFVPDESYTTSDALPSEWMDCIRAYSSVVKRPLSITSTTINPDDSPKKARDTRNANAWNGALLRATPPTSSRASLMDGSDEMDQELERMIELASFDQQEVPIQQMKPRPPSSNNEDGPTMETSTTIKENLHCLNIETSLESTIQMAKKLVRPPRLELLDCSATNAIINNHHTASPAHSTSSMLSSPQDRKYMWSLILFINQAHNMYSRERSCSRWGCHYTLLTQQRSAIERLSVNSQTCFKDRVASARILPQLPLSSSNLEVQFKCTHKFWLAGTTLMVQAYLRNNRTVRFNFRNNMYASTCSASEGEFYGVLELSKLLHNREIDTTIDILSARGDPTITPRKTAAKSRTSPYLSLSVQLTQMSIDLDEAIADNNFVELGRTLEGLQVLRKMS